MRRRGQKLTAFALALILALSAPVSEVAASTVSGNEISVVADEEVVQQETNAQETENASEEVAVESEAENSAETIENQESLVETGEEMVIPTESVEESAEETKDFTETESVDEIESDSETIEASEIVDESEAEISANEISANDVSMNDISVNDICGGEELIDASKMFPGLPEGWSLSETDLMSKSELNENISLIVSMEEGDGYVAGRILVEAEDEETAQVYAEAYGGVLSDYFFGVGVIELPEGVTTLTAIKMSAMNSDELLLPAAWPDFYRELYGEVTEEISGDEEMIIEPSDEENIVIESSEEDAQNDDAEEEDVEADSEFALSELAYNDPALSSKTSTTYQWHHNAIGSPVAWNAGYTGAGIKIGVIDGGYTSHTDLGTNVKGSYTLIPGSTVTTDESDGHGTHVAGLIGAKANNNAGGAGVAPGASVYTYKVFLDGNSNSGSDSVIMKAMTKAASEQKVNIINMSLGGPGYSTTFKNFCSNLVKTYGVAVFVAAGNECSNAKVFPAAYPGMITVAAVDKNKTKTYFSNQGSWVALCAPGKGIYSTIPTNTYGLMDGTSQATPITAGAAAIIMQAKPELKGNPTALLKFMKSNVTKCSGGKIGSGTINLIKALKLSAPEGTPVKPVLSLKGGTYNQDSVSVKITAENGYKIYYSVNGKNPSYKAGKMTNCSAISNGSTIKLSGKSKVTLKAIAVNSAGVSSAVTSATYTLKPYVSSFIIWPATTNITSVIQGKSLQLKTTVTPAYAANKSMKWEITQMPANANAKAIKISSSGKLTVSKNATVGTYTIKATAKDRGTVSSTIKITVKAATDVVSSITFNPTTSTIKVKESLTLPVTVKIGKTVAAKSKVNFYSSDTSIATVNKTTGVVTGVKAGKVKITAIANDGGTKTGSCTVIVKQPVTSISVAGPGSIAVGKSGTFKATISPGDASNKKVTWSVTTSTGATTKDVTVNSSGKVTVKKNASGSYRIYAAAKDGSGVSNYATVKVIASTSAINKMSVSSKAVTINRVAGNYGSATSATITLTAKDKNGFVSSQWEVQNSAPDLVEVTRSGSVITVKAAGTGTGKATITFAATDGSGKKVSSTVTVVNPPSRMFISTQSGRNEMIGVGKKLQLKTSFEQNNGKVSNKKVVWTSSNSSVATVSSSGVVKMLKKGSKVTITATLKDDPKVKETFTVEGVRALKSVGIRSLWSGFTTVIDKAPEGYGYTLRFLYDNTTPTVKNNELYIGSDKINYRLSVTVSDPSVISVKNNGNGISFCTLKKGTVKITVKAMDGSGASQTYKVKID